MSVLYRLTYLVAALPLLIGAAAAPATYAAAPRLSTNTAATTLIQRIHARFPKATVQINVIGGHRKSYAVYVSLTGQPNATLAGGAAASVLASYVQAYPHQGIYALYSYERHSAGSQFWEYEYVPAATLLRRYRFALTPQHAYPWTSWRLSKSGLLQAAHTGVWPSNAITHTPFVQSARPAKKK